MMKNLNLIKFAATAATGLALAGTVASSAQAADLTGSCFVGGGCNLSDLVSDPANFFRVGDKVFDGFSATLAPGPFGSPTPSDLSAIEITGLLNPTSGDVSMNITGGFSALAGEVVDLNVFFNVTADPGNLITDVDLFGNLTTNGDGYGEIVETIFDNSPGAGSFDVIGSGSVNTSGLTSTVPDSITIALAESVSSIRVNKDILLRGGSASGSGASLSLVSQGFQQTAVPTPALLPGLIGFGASLLRKRNKQEKELA